ncbi:MAG: peptide deformylase [Alphaproteobacteria bacterium]|nr:peptide deformylase [Alphaproteobacteria bacterium]MBU0798346.1 peptide deformylase [Alphaproteobacteria bacterium]MBU0887447.1 peptide deformylase [Alphaproteobacteria bacterium]MBU1813344.1 peptide deformylase [Alphaproteobacteria bacterium]MBU2091193.1 peptide deformylase [Alphaproteobacteria bacterium]
MAVLPLVVAPDPRLKKKAQSVERVDDTIRKQMDDMLETMYAENGLGLAAPQVGISNRVIVMDIARRDEEPIIFKMANPEVIWESPELKSYEEGCLSVPEHYADVERPARIKLRYLDYENEIREIEADDVLAVCVQHEIDHLNGILFIDHLSALKRNIIARKLVKAKKAAAEPAAV